MEDENFDPKAMHPGYDGLTYSDVEKAKARARKAAEEVRRQKTFEKIEKEEFARLEKEEGISSEPMVEITLNLSPDMRAIVLDGRSYFHRGTYSVRQSVAADLLYTQFLGWRNESVRKGEDNYAFYAQRANAVKEPTKINGRTGAVLRGRVLGGAPDA